MLTTLHYCFSYLLYGQNLTEKYIVIILIEAIIAQVKHSQNETDKSLSYFSLKLFTIKSLKVILYKIAKMYQTKKLNNKIIF